MVKHVIIWNLKHDLTEEEKTEVKANAKKALEDLNGRIPGLNYLKIYIDGLDTSTGDMLLDSELTDANALKGYAIHPEHVAAANTYVRPYTEVRSCFDYEI